MQSTLPNGAQSVMAGRRGICRAWRTRSRLLKATPIIAALCAVAMTLSPASGKTPSFLTAQSTHFVNAQGEAVILKGCNLGSWLNLEMWMMDVKDDVQYPDQYTVEQVLQERFGKTEKDRFMELHRENWITERDFKIIQSFGFNCIRVPFHYSLIENDDNPMHLKKDAWKWFDRVIDLANQYDFYVILDLHGAAGNQNLFDHSGRKDWNKLWEDRVYWERTAWLWKQIATRYKDCATIAAYQPINEPWGGTVEQQAELFDYLYKAIREKDTRHIIISSAHFTGFDHFGDPKEHGWAGVGFSQNFYPGMFGGGSIRPETHRLYLDSLDDWLKPKLDALNIPFLITEFNVVFDAAGGAEMMRRHYDRYAELGWAATMWSYKLITSPGRKNTGGWWLITNTGKARTGAWWIVTNKAPLPAVDFRTADKSEIEGWFRAFSTVEYEVNTDLQKALTASKPPPPIPPAVAPTMKSPPAHDPIPGWTATDVNNAPAGGQKRVADNAIDLYAAGKDIWGTEDQFRFIHKKVTGDFTLSATINAFTYTHNYAKAGIMIRQSLRKDARFATAGILPDGAVEFAARPTQGRDVWSQLVMGPEMPGIRLRLVRRGDVIERSFACGGGEWDVFDEQRFDALADEVHVGLYCMSHDNGNYATAKFRDIAFTEAPAAQRPVRHSNCTLANGQPLLGNNDYPAMCYSGDRNPARTQANSPSLADIKEDLRILYAMGVRLIRTYNTAEFPQSARILQAIRELREADPKFEMYVMLGAWINCKGAFTPEVDHSQEDPAWNKTEIDKAIELAHAYPDIAKIIAVGNEAMVHWQGHFVHPSVILKWVKYLDRARRDGRMPATTLITTSDNWAALGGEEAYHNEDLIELLRQIDFVSLHTYAFHDTHYNQALKWGVLPSEKELPVTEQAKRSIMRAIESQKGQFAAVEQFLKACGIDKPIHIGETGWATVDNALYSYDGTCAADEYLSKLFYDEVKAWTTQEKLTCFYFEAFDEPWKSNGTAGSEGHFGLFTVDGQAKYPMWDLVDEGAFNGLARGGKPVRKSHEGDVTVLQKKLKLPACKR